MDQLISSKTNISGVPDPAANNNPLWTCKKLTGLLPVSAEVNEIVKVRKVPFKHMIYLGDGPTDIPCFSMIQKFGGTTFGLMGETPKELRKGLKIAQGSRFTVGPYSQNYNDGSDLRKMLDTVIEELCTKISAECKLERRNQTE